MSVMDRVLGPRVSAEEAAKHRERYRLPTMLFVAAMLVLLVSLFFPYWHLDLKAPQFPQGLHVAAYVNRLVGDVDPITGSNDLDQLDGLNHYVGMPPLGDGAQFERTIALAGIIVMGGLLLAAVYVHSRWVVLLVLPALLFPVIFLADLQYWLWHYGHSLDPRAPLAGAVGEFTPHLFGGSKIAQFNTNATPGIGLFLAGVASVLVAVGLWFHRKAYLPLVRAAETEAEAETTGAAEPVVAQPSSP